MGTFLLEKKNELRFEGINSVKSAQFNFYTQMRVLSIVCLSAYAAAKTIPEKNGALRINLEKEPSKSPSAEKKKSKKTKKKNGTPVVTLHAAPKPEYPQGQVSSPIQYIDPNDIDTSFGKFAKQMQHPAYLNSETMLREMIEKGKKMGREDLAAKFAEKLNLPKEEKRLQCFECSGNSYEECYRQGQKRTCGSTETSCMLEVRFQGSVNSKNGPEVRQVRSGCQQKVACINNMKQNFWEIDGNKVNLADSHMHNCKIFSQPEDVSVCRNCCFKDNCTKDWQPKNYEDLNKAPTLKKDSKKSKKSKPEKDEKPFNPVINLKKISNNNKEDSNNAKSSSCSSIWPWFPTKCSWRSLPSSKTDSKTDNS